MNTKINPALVEKVKRTCKIIKTTVMWVWGTILAIGMILMVIAGIFIAGDFAKKSYNQSPTLQNVVNTPSKVIEEVKSARELDKRVDSIRKVINQTNKIHKDNYNSDSM